MFTPRANNDIKQSTPVLCHARTHMGNVVHSCIVVPSGTCHVTEIEDNRMQTAIRKSKCRTEVIKGKEMFVLLLSL